MGGRAALGKGALMRKTQTASQPGAPRAAGLSPLALAQRFRGIKFAGPTRS